MSDSGIALFDTEIGVCAVAWRPEGLAGVQLPEASEGVALRRIRRRFPDLGWELPPPWVEEAIDAIRSLLSGNPIDLGFVPLDFSALGAFEASVLRAARTIPPGGTTTYGELAAQVGDRNAAQAVGQALGRNPWPIVVPCHRVTAAAGRTGGFSAHGGAATKLRLLEIEGALAAEKLPLFAEPGKA
jgi:methylated-DNA-[protein]-cysteine S-methyltransferase